MNNQDTGAAQTFHNATKLEYINLRNKPSLFKTYSQLPVVPLPTVFPAVDTPTLQALAGTVSLTDGRASATSGAFDVTAVTRLLFHTAGLVRQAMLPSAGLVQYRAAASAGALYPIDVYLVCQDIPGLDAGVYHFAPETFALRPLRKGDYRAELVEAAGQDQNFATAPGTLVFTANFWRSAWKYRARGYRYCFWDCGTMLANLLALCSALDLPAGLVTGFVDKRVDTLLRIQGEEESSICLVPVGTGGQTPSELDMVEPAPLTPDRRITAADPIDYPETSSLHQASCLTDEAEVIAWRTFQPEGADDEGSTIEAEPSPASLAGIPQSTSLGEVIRKRGSTRRFSRDPISRTQLDAIVRSAAHSVPADLHDSGGSLIDVYAIVNNVEGMPSGSYFFSPQSGELETLREGNFREEAGHLCFEQALGADASVITFFMADLEKILERYGNRGYRAAQLEAGICGGKVYLSAHSLGLGATGMTFYDDDVTDFFSPHAEGKSLMFLVAAGVEGRPNRVRPFRSRIAVNLDSRARGASKDR